MLINVASGLTGKYLLTRDRLRLQAARDRLTDAGTTPDAIEERLYRDSLTNGRIKRWRTVHVPITLAFAVLEVARLIATGLFWDWQ